MEEARAQLGSSDAWLLLALIYAGEPADRQRISRVGDGIQHALLTEEELDGGLQRLQAAGYVAEAEERYWPTPAVIVWYERISPNRARILKDLERVERFLGVKGK